MSRVFSFLSAVLLVLGVLLALPAWADDADPDRLMQLRLIWTGDYDGFADGVVGPITKAAIKSFQANHGFDQSGDLTGEQNKMLADEADKAFSSAGFEMQFDKRTGTSLGIPTMLTHPNGTTDWGSKWTSASGNIFINTMNFSKDFTLDDLYKQISNKDGRTISYSYKGDGDFILSGTDNDGSEFYVRMIAGQDEVRGYVVDYEQAISSRMKSIVIAMASSFNPFPTQEPEATTAPVVPDVVPAATSARATTPTLAPEAKTSLRSCLNGLGDCPKAFK